MIETEVSFTSLCFIEDHHDERVWLHRLADIEDGELHSPFKSDRIDNRFENRDCWYLYQHRDNRDNGPSDNGAQFLSPKILQSTRYSLTILRIILRFA